jgi:hypothetical protein
MSEGLGLPLSFREKLKRKAEMLMVLRDEVVERRCKVKTASIAVLFAVST